MAGPDAEHFTDPGFGESSQYSAHLDRGWALFDRGDLDAARTSASQAQELRPEDPDSEMLQGAIAVAEGKLEDGLRCYERAMELDPDYLEPYLTAAQLALLDLDDPVRALRYCDDAADLEHLTAFDRLEIQLIAVECELAQGDERAARRRLHGCSELGVLEHALELATTSDDAERTRPDDDPDWATAAEYLGRDLDGEPLEVEERAERSDRVVQLALRVARTRMDVGDFEVALDLTRSLVERFPGEPDAWYLASEAEHRAGDPRRSALAALRTLQLDAQADLPSWLPAPADLHGRVRDIASTFARANLQALTDADEFLLPILVQEHPSPELVAEGVDPRVPALALAARRAGEEGKPNESTFELTAVTVYVRNLLRFSPDLEQFYEELQFSVLDELAAFFGLGNEQREALGLPPLPPEALPEEAAPSAPEETTEPSVKRSRRRNRAAKSSSS